MRLVVYGAISRAAGTSPRHIERATSMSLDDRDWYRKEIARRGRLPRSQQTKARVAGAIRLAGLLALPLAFGAPAIGHWLRPQAPAQRQVCVALSSGTVCRPAIDAVLIGPSLVCLRIGTGMACPPAPQYAFDRRMPDAVAGRNGAPAPAYLYMQWGLCNDAGQWHDTPGCNKTFPDVRHPRPID
jgi:hypothetical protein